MKARIAPPPPMALPGTYDFARDAWFQGIGGVGKALGTLTVVKPAQPQGLERARTDLRQHIATRLPVELGRDRHRPGHRRPECRGPERCGRDAAQRPHAPAVGQRAAHCGGRRLRHVAQPQAARLERAPRVAPEPGAGLGRRRRRGGHRLYPAHRRAGADGAQLRRRAADPCWNRARPRRHQHPPDRRRSAGRPDLPPRSARRAELPDELHVGDCDRCAPFDRLGAQALHAPRRGRAGEARPGVARDHPDRPGRRAGADPARAVPLPSCRACTASARTSSRSRSPPS